MALLTGCATTARPPAGTQTGQSVTRQVPMSVDYLLYLPPDYDTRAQWPLLLFLHGSGERGNDLERVKKHGPPKRIAQGHHFPFIVVSPQVPENQRWSSERLALVLDEVQRRYNVDPDRVYVTGLSMGGYGTWDLAMDFPDRFAAIAPICGGGDTWRACSIRHVPTWVFHGAKDEVVPVERSEELIAVLQGCNGDVRSTIYLEAGHDAWTETYDNPELYEWLLAQRRRPAPQP